MINNNFINILPCLQEVRKSGLISKFSETEQEGSTIKNFKLNSLPNQTSHMYIIIGGKMEIYGMELVMFKIQI